MKRSSNSKKSLEFCGIYSSTFVPKHHKKAASRTWAAGALLALFTPFSYAAYQVDVNWDSTTRNLPPEFFSINHFQMFDTTSTWVSSWKNGIQFIAPGSLRFHNGEFMKKWYDPQTDDWRYADIKKSFDMRLKGTEKVMLSINAWPASYADASGRLRSQDTLRFAALNNRLVSFLKTQYPSLSLIVEVPNEKEDLYANTTDGPDAYAESMGKIYRNMKQANPDVPLAGPAFKFVPSTSNVSRFYGNPGIGLDYLTFHYYSTGSATLSNQEVAQKFRSTAQKIATLAKSVQGKAGIMLTEYNINYAWQTPDLRMATHESAAFDLYFLIHLMPIDGLVSTFAWNDLNSNYGKLGSQGEFRPSAYLYHFLNGLFVGTVCNVSAIGLPDDVAIAAILKGGKKRIAASNVSNATQKIVLSPTGKSKAAYTGVAISATGTREIEYTEGEEIALAPMSDILLWE
ncbi:Hypothetical protein HDN1F_23430 [gamma proteobacterium HdN1]|nr:Hypothetical protein HDN1F_23430 [gamma proteobacterium HdN1]